MLEGQLLFVWVVALILQDSGSQPQERPVTVSVDSGASQDSAAISHQTPE